MKNWLIVILFSAASTVWSEPGVEIRAGQSQADVVALLGEPEGFIRMGETVWLSYARGMVKLVDDGVVEANLISPEAAVVKRQKEQAERARFEQAQAEEKARRIEQGRLLKASRINNPEFLATPISYQVTFWKEFQTRYPEVPAWDEYELARARLEQEQEQLRQQQVQENRIRELEIRLEEAELRQERYSRTRYVYSPIVYYPYTSYRKVVSTRYVKCPTVAFNGNTTLLTSPQRYARNRPVGMSMAAQSSYY